MQGLNISKLLPWKQLGFLVAGLILLGWVFVMHGCSSVTAALVDGLTVFPAVLVLSFFGLFLHTLAWQLTIKGETGSFWSLFKLETIGNTLRTISPFALVGGDALQGDLLRKKHDILSPAESIVADRAVNKIATAAFVWVALMVGILNITDFAAPIRIGIGAGILIAGLVSIGLLRSGKGGPFSALATKLPCCKSPAEIGARQELDRQLLNFYNERRGTFYQTLILHIIAWGLLVAEIYLIGSATLSQFTVAWALLLSALIIIVRNLFCFLPGALGVLELSFAGPLALAFGCPACAAGVAIALLYRLRCVVWIVIGLVLTGNPFKMFLGK